MLAVGIVAAAAGAAAVAAVDEPAPQRALLAAGAGCAALLLIVLVRLGLLSRTARRQVHREATLREAAGALAAARDVDEIRRVVLRTCREVAGSGTTSVVWADLTPRGPAVVRAIGPNGDIPPLQTAAMQTLDQLPDLPDGPTRIAHNGSERAVYPVPRRTGNRSIVVVTARGAVPAMVDEVLVTLCTQSGLALDAVAQAQERLEERSEARFSQLVRHSSDAVLIVDRQGRICYQTPSVVQVLGHPSQNLDGAHIDRLVGLDDRGRLSGFLDQLVQGRAEAVRSIEVQLVRADGVPFPAEVVGSNLLDTPDVDGIVLTVRDVTSRRALEDELRHQAFHDSLTGLANRALFLNRVEHAIHRAERASGPPPALAFLDLDDFKLINDTLGHAAGDEVLRVVAERIRSCLRSGDTPARLGGDEFAVLVEDSADERSVQEIADRILRIVQEPIVVHGTELRVRASIGVAHQRGVGTSADELLRNADLAMYAAKAGGKGTMATFELMAAPVAPAGEPPEGELPPRVQSAAAAAVLGRMGIRGELERSIERSEIGLAYQPIVRLATGEVVAFEALARWTHEQQGPVPPTEFVPMAEESGAIISLGRQVLERSCRQLAGWRLTEGGSGWSMHVNLSLREVLSAGLVAGVQRAAEVAGLAVASLVFEINERVVCADDERVAHQLERLRSLGARIAVDDFGSGRLSVEALRGLPFDVLKIDRRLVTGLRGDDPEVTPVRSAMDLVRSLGCDVIAEGVEDPIEVESLLALGCELGQGHLFSKPAEATALADDLGLPRSA